MRQPILYQNELFWRPVCPHFTRLTEHGPTLSSFTCLVFELMDLINYFAKFTAQRSNLIQNNNIGRELMFLDVRHINISLCEKRSYGLSIYVMLHSELLLYVHSELFKLIFPHNSLNFICYPLAPHLRLLWHTV